MSMLFPDTQFLTWHEVRCNEGQHSVRYGGDVRSKVRAQIPNILKNHVQCGELLLQGGRVHAEEPLT